MRTPRGVSGRRLAKALEQLWYREVRQSGSHIRLATSLNGDHHLTIPDHKPLKVGTLDAILKDVATHHSMTKAELKVVAAEWWSSYSARSDQELTVVGRHAEILPRRTCMEEWNRRFIDWLGKHRLTVFAGYRLALGTAILITLAVR